MNEAYNMDCMEYMKTIPDKYFDLAVVDPPYGGAGDPNFEGGDGLEKDLTGINPSKEIKAYRTGGAWASKYGKAIIDWDIAPTQDYFNELFRVSKEQIIWGGNYFTLPPTRCFLVWRKLTISETFTMAMAEYAWTSFNGNAKVIEVAPQGKKDDKRFHPTQKPVELYDWIFEHYADKGFKIFDSHLGSGSSRISAWKHNLDFVGTEIDKRYFDLQEERFKRETAQVTWQQWDKDFLG